MGGGQTVWSRGRGGFVVVFVFTLHFELGFEGRDLRAEGPA